METKKLKLVALELEERVNRDTNELLKCEIWVDEEEEQICIAPVKDGFGCVYHLKEVALVAEYFGLSFSTKGFKTGAGVRLY